MKEQLKLLIELQVHDAKIQELEGALKAFPAKFESMQGDVRKVETLLERERQQLADTEAWRKRQADEARDQEDALIRAKQRSQQVKNVKEHMANERELETNRKNAQAREEEVARLGGAVEAAKAALTQHEHDLASMKSHVAEEENAARGKMSEIESQIAALRTDRETAASRVEAAALKKYGTIRMRRGMALVPVKNGTCQGCHMNIPPQLYNTLQRGTTLETCPNCNRIIYWDRLFADPDGQATQKPTPVEKVKRAPRAKAAKAAPTLPAAPPPPDEKRERVAYVAAAGNEPGAGMEKSAVNLRSSSDAAPDTATGPSTATEDEANEAIDEPAASGSSEPA